MRTRPFIGFGNTVTSLRLPYDVTGYVVMRYPRRREAVKPRADSGQRQKIGGATVTRLWALATVRVQKGDIRVYRDILP